MIDGVGNGEGLQFGVERIYPNFALAPLSGALAISSITMIFRLLTVLAVLFSAGARAQGEQAPQPPLLRKLILADTEQKAREAPVLGGKTPRHAATTQAGREQVARLLDEMEQNDPGWSHIGRPAFDYNVLRGHVGIEEVRREDRSAERTR